MTIKQFIKRNRRDIDHHVKDIMGNRSIRLNDEEREEWLMNDESLYNWAKACRVKLW